MCGRYVSAKGTPELLEEFQAADHTDGTVTPDFNVAPTKDVPAVLVRRDERQLRVLRWGLVPSWAKDLRIGARLVNARLETAAEKPAFRSAVRARRCLLPADGYYEWLPPETPKGKKRPVYLHRADGGPLVMAGLYEVWSDAEDRRYWTSTILTTDAVDGHGEVHDRSPVLVPRDLWQAWLDPRTPDPERLLDLLGPTPPGTLTGHLVDGRVNNVANEGPELIRPLPQEDQPALFG